MADKPTHPHGGHRERVRQKILGGGIDNFQDHELIEFLLFHTVPRRDTNELAHRLLNEFGSLEALLEADPAEITRRGKVGEQTAALLASLLPIFRRYRAVKSRQRRLLDSSRKAGEYALSLFTGERLECFYMICLDQRRRVIHPALVSRGSMSETHVYARNLAEIALNHRCFSVILTHNHPAGTLAASSDDIESTRSVMNALGAVGVEVLDHIIVAGDEYLSFTEKKIMPPAYKG